MVAAANGSKEKGTRTKSLFWLIAFDPRWLYEAWAREIIAQKYSESDRDFFKELASKIRGLKGLPPLPRGRKAKQALRVLKQNSFFHRVLRSDLEFFQKGGMPDSIKKAYLKLDLEEDVTEGYFSKLLKRHDLKSRISR